MVAGWLSAANLKPQFYLGTIILMAMILVAFVYMGQDNNSAAAVYELNSFPIERINEVNNFPAEKITTGVKSCYPKKGLRPLKNRDEIGTLLEEHELKTGVEVGVKQGAFSHMVLSKWKSCQSYKLVDPWEHQKNYKDAANVNQSIQNNFFEQTKATLRQYDRITEFYRMYSTEAAKKIEKESLDFVYIDARHDYCAMKEDLEAYWPLVKRGGILAGHDYLSSAVLTIKHVYKILEFFTPSPLARTGC